MDMAWLPSPGSSTSSNLLAAVTEEGSLAILDIECGAGLPEDLSTASPVDDTTDCISCLSGMPSFGSSLLLPRQMSLILRLLIQVATPTLANSAFSLQFGRGFHALLSSLHQTDQQGNVNAGLRYGSVPLHGGR